MAPHAGFRHRPCRLLSAVIFCVPAARAEDALKVAIGSAASTRIRSPSSARTGLFKRRGLVLELLYTQGGGETQQAVISGAVRYRHRGRTLGAMGAFAKGAPCGCSAPPCAGAYEYWNVPAVSPIKSFRSADGRTVAYSTNGSSTNLIVLALAKHHGVTVKPTATGSPVSTLTQP